MGFYELLTTIDALQRPADHVLKGFYRRLSSFSHGSGLRHVFCTVNLRAPSNAHASLTCALLVHGHHQRQPDNEEYADGEQGQPLVSCCLAHDTKEQRS